MTLELRLVYESQARFRDRKVLEELNNIQDTSLRNNSRDEISGILLFTGERFIQVLEGGREVINASYRRISADQRHTSLSLFEVVEIRHRLFRKWSMRVVRPTAPIKTIIHEYGIQGIGPTLLNSKQVLTMLLEISRV